MGRSNVVGAFLLGALAGGAIALLFAPHSGAQTRRKIRGYIDDEVDMVKDRVAQARDLVEDEIDKYKDKMRRFAGDAEEFAEELADEVKSQVAAERRKASRPASASAKAKDATSKKASRR